MFPCCVFGIKRFKKKQQNNLLPIPAISRASKCNHSVRRTPHPYPYTCSPAQRTVKQSNSQTMCVTARYLIQCVTFAYTLFIPAAKDVSMGIEWEYALMHDEYNRASCRRCSRPAYSYSTI